MAGRQDRLIADSRLDRSILRDLVEKEEVLMLMGLKGSSNRSSAADIRSSKVAGVEGRELLLLPLDTLPELRRATRLHSGSL